MQNEMHQKVVKEDKVEVVAEGEVEEAPEVVDRTGTTRGLNVKFATSMVTLPSSAITILIQTSLIQIQASVNKLLHQHNVFTIQVLNRGHI